MNAPEIDVLYTCRACGLRDAVVKVKARTIEDVIVWMENILTPALAADHFARSPRCLVTTLSEVKIPITGVSKLGGPSEN